MKELGIFSIAEHPSQDPTALLEAKPKIYSNLSFICEGTINDKFITTSEFNQTLKTIIDNRNYSEIDNFNYEKKISKKRIVNIKNITILQ